MIVQLLLGLQCLGSFAHAQGTTVPVMPIPDLKKVEERNGIAFAKFDHFWEKWKLVNVRYRTDSQEQRFVYANDIAWKAMKAGKKVFPEGSMFGKIAFFTNPDTSFPVSLEPVSFDRIQLMKKDSKRYADTAGWGYAVVFANDVLPTGLSPKERVEHYRTIATSCHACHAVVPQRDYVFTSGIFLGYRADGGTPHELKDKFVKTEAADLNDASQHLLQDLTGSRKGQVRYLAMNLFDGSVNESMPVVARFAMEDHVPFILFDTKKGHFVGADFRPGPCARVYRTSSDKMTGLEPDVVEGGMFCAGKVTWDERMAFLAWLNGEPFNKVKPIGPSGR